MSSIWDDEVKFEFVMDKKQTISTYEQIIIHIEQFWLMSFDVDKSCTPTIHVRHILHPY